jgi:hypothetical protein
LKLTESFLQPLKKYTLPIETVQLDSCDLLAEGRSRLVYACPGDNDKLIKLPRFHRRSKISFRTLRSRIRPSGCYKSFIKELLEYRRLERVARPGQLPIPAIRGLVKTTLGLGLLVDAVKDESGNGLAPTLDTLLSEGKAPSKFVTSLEALWRSLYELRPSIGDLHPGNIVVGRYDGRDTLFIIDGLGRSVLFPVDLWSRRANHRRLDAAYVELLDTMTSRREKLLRKRTELKARSV